MPIPKSAEDTYGKVVGHLINLGASLATAKKKADKALKDHPASFKQSKKQSQGKVKPAAK